jgi:putative FmdB family regulatory protein
MPTYEFRCEAGHSFDRFLKMSEAPTELACDVCGKTATRQVSGGAGLVFKGSGFYLTDYGRAGQKPSGEGAAVTGGDTKSGESKPTKSDSSAAPAAAPAAKPDKSSPAKTKPGE